VSDDWEWDPARLKLCRKLEGAFVRELKYEVFLNYGVKKVLARDVVMELTTLAGATKPLRPPLILIDATPTYVRELATHRWIFRGVR
jgi:hypothetical protein